VRGRKVAFNYASASSVRTPISSTNPLGFVGVTEGAQKSRCSLQMLHSSDLATTSLLLSTIPARATSDGSLVAYVM